MQQRFTTNNGEVVLELVLKWKMGTISLAEMECLNNWHYSFEGVNLTEPDDVTLETIERRWHHQYYKPIDDADKSTRLNPLHPKE